MTPRPWHSLDGKVIWVTGGAGYFGSAVTAALDSVCRKVICLDRDDRAAALIRQRSLSNVVPLSFDLSAVEALPELIESTIADHGVPDGLVQLAYASLGAGIAMADLPAETFARTLQHNLSPAFVLCRGLAERMKPRGSGSVVLFSSMYGLVAPDPAIYHRPMLPNPVDYGASKAALLQLSRYLAVHYGPNGLRFNCVTPGAFPHPPLQQSDTVFVQRLAGKSALGRIGQADDIVGPTLFLLTDSATFVTGHNLVVDGGWTAW